MKLPVTHPSVRDLFQTLGRHEAFQHLVSESAKWFRFDWTCTGAVTVSSLAECSVWDPGQVQSIA